MKPARTLAVCIAIGLSSFTVHAQFQIVHNVPNTTTTPELVPLILADGSTVTYHWDAGQHIFRKYDTNGDLVWSKAFAGSSMTLFSGDQAISLVSDGADGFRFARLSEVTDTPIDSLFQQDQIEISIQVGHVNGTGDMTDAFLVRKTFQNDDFWASFQYGFNAARTPDNGMVLAMTFSEAAAGKIDMVKIDTNGAVAWAKSVGNAWTGMPEPEPTNTFDNQTNARVAVSASGGIYYTEGSPFLSNLRLAELDSNGEMLWMKRYIYANIPPSAGFNDIQVDGAGNVHAGGLINTSVGYFHIFLRTNPDGVLDRGDLYRTPVTFASGEFRIDGEGRRYQRTNSYSSVPNGSQGILIADTLGSPAQFHRRADQVVLPNNVFIAPRHIDVAGSRLAISGLLNHEDVNLAYTTRYETLASISTSFVSSCLMDDTTYADIPIPMAIMTTEDVPNAASIDVSAYYSSQPLALTLTDLGTDPLEPFCTFVNELLLNTTGVGESPSNGQPSLVLSSLVAQGSPLVISDPGVSAVDVYTIYGALVQHSSVVGTKSIPTTGWATGVYLLHALDGHGGRLRAERIVVE